MLKKDKEGNIFLELRLNGNNKTKAKIDAKVKEYLLEFEENKKGEEICYKFKISKEISEKPFIIWIILKSQEKPNLFYVIYKGEIIEFFTAKNLFNFCKKINYKTNVIKKRDDINPFVPVKKEFHLCGH